MCGIVGLFSKSPAIASRMGEHLAAMLAQMSDRGPDSAGVAIYRDPAGPGASKLTLFSPEPDHDWNTLRDGLATAFGGDPEPRVNASHAVVVVEAEAPDAEAWVREHHPDLRVMSAGQAIEIYKEMGLPRDFVARFDLTSMEGSHALGHTRMATESRVTTEHSHPFSTGLDLCLVHNGSLSNHNRLRRELRREGISFDTDNDSEVAAGYLTWRLREGASLNEALEGCLDDLDGFYTFAVGTRRRVRRHARSDRMQAGGAGRDRRLGRDGVRVPRDLGPPGRRGRGGLGAGAGTRVRVGARARLMAATDTEVSVVDLATTPLRELNQRLHDAATDGAGPRRWRIVNPSGAHAVACGLDADIEVEIDGHVGYYCAGMNQHATVRVRGNAGVGVAENMMSGLVVVDGNASQSAGASAHGGLLSIQGDASARCGISMKGVDIVVRGSVGHMSCFMAQAGRLVVCGDAGEALGDSIYEARLYVRGSVASLGADCVEKDLRDEHRAELRELLDAAGLQDADPGEFRRYGSARELYTFKIDNAY